MECLKVLNHHSQIRVISSELKFKILQELIKCAATCQQLADTLNVSRQKTHYSLKQLMDESLIEVASDHLINNKEIFYRATAKNYVLDLSIGTYLPQKSLYSRELINSILKNDYGIDLREIASKLIDESLKLKPKEKLLIITGQSNMPLAEKLILEASQRSIVTTIFYEDQEIERSINSDFSLSTLKVYLQNRLKHFKANDVVLVLNREKDTVPVTTDPKKKQLLIKHQSDINNLLKTRKNEDFRIGAMVGYLMDDLSQGNIASEIRFWRSLDINYDELQQETKELADQLYKNEHYLVTRESTEFSFNVDKIICEYGSYGNYEYRSSVLNLPGGEVLIVPKEKSIQGEIHGATAYFAGKKIENISITLKDNCIVDYNAEENYPLLKYIIENGGPDGREIAMVCFGTNSSVNINDNNPHYRHKRKGVMSIYWGDNSIFGGKVKGHNYWILEIVKPELNPIKFGVKKEATKGVKRYE